jgi:hypothetical protein
MDIVTYALCKKMASGAASGVESFEVQGQTLVIKTKDGQTLNMDFPTPENGVSITEVSINEQKQLICTMSDGEVINAGEVPSYIPQKGVDYYTEEDKKEIEQDVIESVNQSIILEII